MSHHGNNPEKMKSVREAEHLSRRDDDVFPEEARRDSGWRWDLLDRSDRAVGGGMSDGNTHNNYSVPVVAGGRAAASAQGKPPRDVPEGHAARESHAGRDGQIRRTRGEVRRQSGGDRLADGVVDAVLWPT